MGFNKKMLQECDKLSQYLKDNGSHQFYRMHIRKVDAFIGPHDSMNFINMFIEKYRQSNLQFFEI